MKKGLVIATVLVISVLVLVFSLSYTSWFGDFFAKITGHAVYVAKCGYTCGSTSEGSAVCCSTALGGTSYCQKTCGSNYVCSGSDSSTGGTYPVCISSTSSSSSGSTTSSGSASTSSSGGWFSGLVRTVVQSVAQGVASDTATKPCSTVAIARGFTAGVIGRNSYATSTSICGSGYTNLGKTSDYVYCCAKIMSTTGSTASSTSNSTSPSSSASKTVTTNKTCNAFGIEKGFIASELKCQTSNCAKNYYNLGATSDCTYCCAGAIETSSNCNLQKPQFLIRSKDFWPDTYINECKDTDGGKNPCEKGLTKSQFIIRSMKTNESTYFDAEEPPFSDICINNKVLREFYCITKTESQGMYQGSAQIPTTTYTYYVCPGTCSNGACV